MARSVKTNVTNTVFRKNFNYAVLNVTTLAAKTGHFLRAMDRGDSHDIAPFKCTKLPLFFILDGNNWSTLLSKAGFVVFLGSSPFKVHIVIGTVFT